jgi:hypothetical protein
VDDLQRSPSDKDRARVAARIRQAHDQGRISTADRDIRLGNVSSAQSMTELDLMSRDLDQLEASLPPAGGATPSASTAPWSDFDPAAAKRSIDVTASGAPRRFVAVVAVVVAIVLLGGAVLAVLGQRLFDSAGPSVTPQVTDAADPDPNGSGDTDVDVDASPAYALTASGVRDFLAAYRSRFHTSRVVDMTLYGDYVIVNVPVAGGRGRQEGWLYRQRAWTSFGGVRAVFPGSQPVDTAQLSVPALMRNVARAKRTLNVEPPVQAYAIVRWIPRVDETPTVDIHVTNKFQESGYLATTLDGKVLRSYAFGQ